MLRYYLIILFFFLATWANAQQMQSGLPIPDSTNVAMVFSKKKALSLNDFLKENTLLNSRTTPVIRIQAPHRFISKDSVFYLLTIILLLLGVLKVAYSRYFNTLIRVFFNTTLRQSQLTDQLLQAKLPSLLFNLFFVIISGWYIYLLLNHFGKVKVNSWNILMICMSGCLIIYLIKFYLLKFTGWLTGFQHEADTYIFIVFLLNKMIAVSLVPFVVIIPFAGSSLVNIAMVISYIIIAAMFIMRFLRSYDLLQSRIKISGFHFMLYITGIELLPVLLIYKGALVIISKNL